MISHRNLVLLVAAAVALITFETATCAPVEDTEDVFRFDLDDLIRKIGLLQHHIIDDFNNHTKYLFDDPQSDAEAKFRDDPRKAALIKAVSAKIGLIVSRNYAIESHAMDVIEKFLRSCSENELGSATKLPPSKYLPWLFAFRALLRSFSDSQNASKQEMFKLAEEHLNNDLVKTDDDVAHLFEKIFGVVLYENNDCINRIRNSITVLLDIYMKETKAGNQQEIWDVVDEVIDREMGCSECREKFSAEREANEDGLYPIFDAEAVEAIVREKVDRDLRARINKSNDEISKDFGSSLSEVPADMSKVLELVDEYSDIVASQ